MKKQNGFTLIELLAVIVILAIIALIATPLILKVIDESRKKAIISSLYGVFKSTENYIIKERIEVPFDYKIINGEASIDLNIKGKIDGSGDIKITSKGESYAALWTKYGCVTNDNEKSDKLIFNETIKKEIDCNLNHIIEYEEIAKTCKNLTIPDSSCFETNGAGSITKYNCFKGNATGHPEITKLKIPNSINGESITKIGQNLFYNKKLECVEVEEGITAIENNAFYVNELVSLKLPTTLKTIGTYVFNANNLPDDQATIYARKSDGSLDKTKVVSYGGRNKDVVIPEGVEIIENNAYISNKLESVKFPSTLKRIGYTSFMGNRIKSLDIPTSVTTISGGAFTDNLLPDEEGIIFERKSDGTEEKTRISSYAGENRDKVSIPNGVTTIASSAFFGTGIKRIEIPPTVRSISSNTFLGNSGFIVELLVENDEQCKRFDTMWTTYFNNSNIETKECKFIN